MKKTQYIKGKDGKFKGSIGSGKTAVPQQAPTIPTAPGPGQQKEPLPFPRAQHFTDLVSRHAHAFSNLALYGITPAQAARYSRQKSDHYQVLVPTLGHQYLAQPLYSPKELSDIYSTLNDGDHNQKQVLLQLEYLTDSCTDFAEFAASYCDECPAGADLNAPEYYDGEYCSQHEYIGDITNLSDVTPLINSAAQAVEEDYLPNSDSDREAVIVLTTLLPDPYHPENYPST